MGQALPGSTRSYESTSDEVQYFEFLAEHNIVELTSEPTEVTLSWRFTQNGIQRLRYSSGLSVGVGVMRIRHEVQYCYTALKLASDTPSCSLEIGFALQDPTQDKPPT